MNLVRRKLLFAMSIQLSLFSFATANQDDDEASIRDIGEKYVIAANSKDAAAVAAFWSPEAVYTNRLTGEEVTGREAIEKQFTELFENAPDIKYAVEVSSIDFLSPNVAVEKGVAVFQSPDQPADRVPYSAVYVRRDGKWLLDRVTDEPQPVISSNYEKLQGLEWMIGTWVDEDENFRIETECRWTKNKNFITRTFTVTADGEFNLSGLQVIGYDAADDAIRSWTFDSTGGISEGAWQQDGDRWTVRKTGILPSGEKASSVKIVTRLDDDRHSVRVVSRTSGGRLLPNVPEVTVRRSAPAGE